MHTKTVGRKPRTSVEDLKRILQGPLELVIDDATSYWLEDVSGARLSEESTRTKAPFARALGLYRGGRDPDTMRLVARLVTGERYELEGGPILIDLAEASAGIPARPRTPLPPDAP
jgi:hypothetical protein